jgi:hypothetical protein
MIDPSKQEVPPSVIRDLRPSDTLVGRVNACSEIILSHSPTLELSTAKIKVKELDSFENPYPEFIGSIAANILPSPPLSVEGVEEFYRIAPAPPPIIFIEMGNSMERHLLKLLRQLRINPQKRLLIR